MVDVFLVVTSMFTLLGLFLSVLFWPIISSFISNQKKKLEDKRRLRDETHQNYQRASRVLNLSAHLRDIKINFELISKGIPQKQSLVFLRNIREFTWNIEDLSTEFNEIAGTYNRQQKYSVEQLTVLNDTFKQIAQKSASLLSRLRELSLEIDQLSIVDDGSSEVMTVGDQPQLEEPGSIPADQLIVSQDSIERQHIIKDDN